ncbi:hypothetical protein BD289DRAFT_487382 [Coniella lustricola]|uniref:2-oxoadipate dioxygenase/decarboxylase n=1 Tax=Coniella lustricola TaxID=2025994 RepID=A0A2T2ZS27_9PEZI|nr:hypothetical protein BD289DRAFT_487382 [Coniella lustricola]
MPSLVSPTQLRLRFAQALTRMYRQEVPQYAVLEKLVDQVNAQHKSTLSLPEIPRHGAVRLASLEEMRIMSRFLGVMDMKSVGHYNLAAASLPVHATAFRPTTTQDMAAAPFRLFTSVLRPELLERDLQPLAQSLLAQRTPIFSARTLELVRVAEQRAGGGLTAAEADEFVQGGCETLAWRHQVSITRAQYGQLKAARNGDLLLDILAFRNPHLNHLTPATVAIEAVQRGMHGVGLRAKASIEGPPAQRACPVLLRQTSFLAVDEGIVFEEDADGSGHGPKGGSHCARFGEIEQRGAALTALGRQRYDEVVARGTQLGLLSAAWSGGPGKEHEHEHEKVTTTAAAAVAQRQEDYRRLFDEALPDDWETLRKEGLVWAAYRLTDKGEAFAKTACTATTTTRPSTMQQALDAGLAAWQPMLYEDFLPLSAAGIFQSNLHQDGDVPAVQSVHDTIADSRRQLQEVLGPDGMVDEMELYRAQQDQSRREVCAALGITHV